MRVVHVTRYFHPHTGGTERVIASLARELVTTGVDSRVVVSALDRSGDGPRPEIPVLEVPVVGSSRFPIPVGRLGDVVDELRDADVVHLHDVRFLFELTALVRRPPVVLTTHGLVFHTRASSAVKRAVWRLWLAPRLRRLDRVVAVSERDAALCRDAGVTHVTTIPNGVDVDDFARVPDRMRDEARRLLYFGRVAPEKRVDALAELLRARPGWTLTVAGPVAGEYRRSVADAFADVRGRVTVCGPVSIERLQALLLEADCVVLPSPGESFGLTLVEALAAGIPVVAADAPAYREVGAGTDTGFARFDDAGAAARTIEATVAAWDPSIARRRAGEFSWPAAATAYRKVYGDVLAGRR